ncbi:Hypothetical protein, putative [Bodo saltans]|uniref:C2 domain-containing protein n=1 Tax=Bodo saltans TaxID=75058 RepID=A0A0S4JCS8_BODSA|nr:Hypothetical protein, putative [Bodo saltans]|eukprot:CUG88199.1 Hypothetical protein, putative [Bodo saltans]
MWQRLEAAFGSSSSTAGSGVTSPSNQNTPSSPVPILLMPDVSTPDGAHHYHHSYSGGTGSSSGTAAHAAPPLAAHITLKHIQSLVVSDGRRSPLFEVSSIMLKIKTPREKIKTRPFSVSQNQFFLDETVTVRLVDPASSSSTFSPPPALSAATTVSSPSPSVVASVEDASEVPILDADPNEIHVEVYSCTTFGGKTLICETYISLNNTQRGVPRERSHVLMTPSTGLSRGKRGAKNGGDASSSGKSLFDGGDAEKSGGGGGTVAMRHHAAAPIPCGLLTVVISNDAASRNAAVSEQVERDVQLRFRSFFECYDPSQLSRLDLYVGAALQRNQTHTIMSRLKEAYGPEPGDNRLEVTMDRCRGTLQTDKNGGHSRPFVVLALGMSQFHTRSQYALTDDIAFHRETFTFHVGLPDQQELHVYLMDEGQPSLSIGGAPHQSPSSNKGKSPHLLEGTESGRVLVSLAHMGKRGVPCKRKLPLVFRAGTKDAVTYGTIELTLTSNSFSGQQHHHHHHAGYVASPQSSVGGGGGHRRVSSSFDNNGTTAGGDLDPAITTFEHYQERVLRLLSRYVPEALHRYDIIMGKYVNREEDMMRELVNELGAEPGTYPLYVRIIGFRGPHHFTKGTSTASAVPAATRLVLSDMQQRSEEDHNIHDGDALVIKLLNNGEEVLKTDTCKVDHGVANLSSAQHNDVRTELRDIQGSVLSFELYRRGFFGKKTFLAAADIGVRHLVRDFSNVRWMPLFRVEGDGGVTHHDTDSSGSSQQQQQQSSSSPVSSSSHHHQLSSFIGVIGVELKTQSFGLPSAKRDEEQMSDVGVDVMTLLRKYNPAGLRQLDVFLERTPSVSGAHALLRRTFNPAAASTLYIAIHSIQLELKPAPRGLAGRGGGGSVNGGLGVLGTSTTGKKPAKSLHQNNGNVLSEPAVWKSGETSKRIVCMGLLAGEMVRCEGVCHRGGATVTTIGGDNQQTAALNAFGAMRFDVVPTPSPSEAHGPKSSHNTVGPTLSLQVVETSKNGNITLGAVDISARAILSQPRALLFGTDEGPLTFPIVLVQQSAGSDELFIVSYYRRILKMLQFYDPAALVTFHRTFFDQEVNSGAACKWRLPRLLETLKEQWGPEPRE